MTNQQKMDILMVIYNVLFQSRRMNTDITKIKIVTNMGDFPGRWFVGQTLRGFDVDINVGDKIAKIRCIEQNPTKKDNNGNLKKHANLAAQGHKIMWVIDRNGSWLGHLMDGIWVPSFEPATQAATYTKLNTQPSYDYNTPEHEARLDAAYAHIEKDISDPNFQGIPGTSGTSVENLPIEAAMQHNLPEMPNGADIPDYVLQSISEMEEPPDWGDYE